MSAFTVNEYIIVPEDHNPWMKSYVGEMECVFKKCCKKYKKNGKHCKKCPKK
jgi:hypothetical protein